MHSIIRVCCSKPLLTVTTALPDTIHDGHMVCVDRGNISDNTTQVFSAYGGQYSQMMNPDDHGTSHLSVVDSARGAVALTTTINTGFGSKVVSNSTGNAMPPCPPKAYVHCTSIGLEFEQAAN